MKPAPFTYFRPEGRDEVDALLAELGGDGKILAGGQSLIPILNMRLASPANLIDINHLAGESTAPQVDDNSATFGPLVRQEAALRSPHLAESVPLVAEAMNFVAHPPIRSRGTVVGSVAHADPSAELPAVLVVLSGEVVARGAAGTRAIPAAEFFAGPLENSLRPEEWAVEVRFPTRSRSTGYAFEEFARRRGDFALCGVAAAATRGDDGRVDLAVAYLGVGDAPARLTMDSITEDEVGDAVAELVERNLDPPDDIHATSEFRSHLALRLGERASRRAIDSVPVTP